LGNHHSGQSLTASSSRATKHDEDSSTSTIGPNPYSYMDSEVISPRSGTSYILYISCTLCKPDWRNIVASTATSFTGNRTDRQMTTTKTAHMVQIKDDKSRTLPSQNTPAETLAKQSTPHPTNHEALQHHRTPASHRSSSVGTPTSSPNRKQAHLLRPSR
jgi:hypothetical protein